MARHLVLSALLLAGAAPAAAGDLYPHELRARAPALHRALAASLPSAREARDWLPRLDGTGGPLARVTLDGRDWYAGYVCRPHDCRDNRFVFLVAADGSSAAGLLRLTREGGAARLAATGRPGAEAAADLRLRLDR